MEPWLRIEERALNPWFSMWTRPRATIQQIVAADPKRLVLALAAVAGISEGWDRAADAREFWDAAALPAILGLAAVGGAIFGVCGLYISAAVIRWTGGWLGGQASSAHIRAALAWSCVPVIWVAPLWFPAAALYGRELFTGEKPSLDATLGGHPAMALPLLGFYVAGFVAELWAFVISLHSLGQVQGFSAWRALGNMILAMFLILLATMALAALFGAFVFLVVGAFLADMQ